MLNQLFLRNCLERWERSAIAHDVYRKNGRNAEGLTV